MMAFGNSIGGRYTHLVPVDGEAAERIAVGDADHAAVDRLG